MPPIWTDDLQLQLLAAAYELSAPTTPDWSKVALIFEKTTGIELSKVAARYVAILVRDLVVGAGYVPDVAIRPSFIIPSSPRPTMSCYLSLSLLHDVLYGRVPRSQMISLLDVRYHAHPLPPKGASNLPIYLVIDKAILSLTPLQPAGSEDTPGAFC